MENQRRQYRSSPESSELFAVAVVRSLSILVPGQVVDLSVGGISVFFEHGCDPIFALKDTVQLRLTSPHLKEPLSEPCLVRYRAETRQGRFYGLEFLDWLGLLARLPTKLAGHFNQRGHYRVEPDPNQPVPVRLQADARSAPVSARLRDLSVTGISCLAASEAERTLADAFQVKVSLRLPDSPEVLDFHGNIIRRDLVPTGVCYAVFFDAKLTARFEKKASLLEMYVNERRKQMLDVLSRQP